MAVVLHESDFYLVERVRPGVIRIVRRVRPFLSAADVEQACEPVQRALDLEGRTRCCVMIDTRPVVGRNDPESESMFAHHRDLMVRGFKRVALLVATPAGRLQTARLLPKHLDHVKVFMDENEALEFVESLGPPRSNR